MTDKEEQNRREAWEKIKIHAPGFADDLKAFAAAFGKPQYVEVTLAATGEKITIGEPYKPPEPKTPAQKPQRRHGGYRYRRY